MFSRETLIARINLALVCLARSFVVTSDIASRSVRWLLEGEVSIETCLSRLVGSSILGQGKSLVCPGGFVEGVRLLTVRSVSWENKEEIEEDA